MPYLRFMRVYVVVFLFFLSLFGQAHAGIPLIENRGQWPSRVLFSADVESGKWFLEQGAMTFHQFDLSAISAVHSGETPLQGAPRIRGHVYRVQFEGANDQSRYVTGPALPEKRNYFLGNDPSNWAGNCTAYSEVTLKDVYKQVDLSVHPGESFLKYDFVLHPGSVLHSIRMKYEGQDDLQIENGRLKIRTSVGEVWEQKPVAWQVINGEKVYVQCNYHLEDDVISFRIPQGYNPSYELVIDPELIFSTYSGSTSDNFGYTATYDSEGYLYSGSSAFGQGYPTTLGAYQVLWGGGDGSFNLPGTDIALTKYDVSGTFLIWSTFLGGANDELPHSLICNAGDELLVYGTTSSPNFPVTADAYDTVFNGGTSFSPQGVGTDYVNGSDIIVTRLNGNGSALISSTFLGGNSNDGVNTSSILKFNYADEFRGEIDLDSEGSVFISSSTFSPDFPAFGSFQSAIGGSQDGCLVKLNADLSEVLWSTFIGGTNADSGYSVAFNSQNEIYICGGTKSSNFPVTSGALFNTNQGGSADGWIARVSANGQTLMQSTYFGSSSYDQMYFVDIDNQDDVHVYGQTSAPGNTWVINAAWSEPNSGMVVAKISPQLDEIIWSTVFGSGDGEPNLSPAAFLVDVCGKIYLSGWGGSTNTSSNPATDDVFNMTVTPDAFKSTTTGSDFYLLVLEDDASDIVYGSYYGGNTSAEHVDGGTSRFDRKGIIYQSVCAGCGSNDDFPIYPPNAHSPTNNSNNCNNGVFKFDFQLPLTVADFSAPNVGCVNVPVLFSNSSINAVTYDWDFGDSQSSIDPNPVHEYDLPGEYLVTLVVTDASTCNIIDTYSQWITIGEAFSLDLADASVCSGEQQIIGPDDPDFSFNYEWIPSEYLSAPDVPNPLFTPGESSSYMLLVEHGGCTDTLYQDVEVVALSLDIPEDTTLCDEATLTLNAEYSPASAAIIWSDVPDFSNVLNDGTADPDIIVNPDQPATYYAEISYLGCTLTDEVMVNLVSFQTFIEGDFTACAGDTVELSVLSPNLLYDYTWVPESLVISGQSTPQVTVVVPSETTFVVTSETPEGCTAEDEATVSVSNLLPEMLDAVAVPPVIVQGQSSQLHVEPDGFLYNWIPNGTLAGAGTQSPVATPAVTTTYIVTVQDGECVYDTQVTVRVVDFVCGPPSIYVPNAFTPNADNRNEKLFVRSNNLTELYFVIYDRWGEKVFETDNSDTGWDGTFRGRAVDPDVYVYYLRAICEGGETYFEEGNITVIR